MNDVNPASFFSFSHSRFAGIPEYAKLLFAFYPENGCRIVTVGTAISAIKGDCKAILGLLPRLSRRDDGQVLQDKTFFIAELKNVSEKIEIAVRLRYNGNIHNEVAGRGARRFFCSLRSGRQRRTAGLKCFILRRCAGKIHDRRSRRDESIDLWLQGRRRGGF